MEKCTDLPEWLTLKTHQKEIANERMQDWFIRDSKRFQRFSLKVGDIFLDYSKNLITNETLDLLSQLVDACHVQKNIHALFNGEIINISEKRAALHTALRAIHTETLFLNGQNIMNDIRATLHQMKVFTEKVRQKKWWGSTKKPIDQIVNIGIGGSHLGPLMATHALSDYADCNIQCHFVSNIDAMHIQAVLNQIDPERTLFIISSKSFTTLETMTNANTLRTWLQHRLGTQNLTTHFIAVTANIQKALEFGIVPENIFPLWDWVGGRFSIWSAIGLPLALLIGMDHFLAFLQGAHDMDNHFKTAPFRQNMPMIMALLGIWYINFFNTPHQAIIPYSHALNYFRIHLQQLDMESNGKNMAKFGMSMDCLTAPVLWGEQGSNGQHAFHQLLHQGQHLIPVDFILVGPKKNGFDPHHEILVSSALSQAEALLQGKSYHEALSELQKEGYPEAVCKELARYKMLPGNRPSSMILINKMTPTNLGALIALYEHKIFVQGVIWQINSFDQWGVELGKQLLPRILVDLARESTNVKHSSSTLGLIQYYKNLRNLL